MERRYQVFISSTYEDLQPARQAVSEALLQAKCFPAGMELFPAADEGQFDYIRRVIDESDYYLIISAGKYGSIHQESGLSYTELEYNYAVSIGKPIIRLLHRDPFGSLIGDKIETDEVKRQKLTAFREKLHGSLVAFWDDYNHLGKQVVFGLLEVQQRNPAAGWVRAHEEKDRTEELQDLLISQIKGITSNPGVSLEDLPMPCIRINSMHEVEAASASAIELLGASNSVGKKIEDLIDPIGGSIPSWISDALAGYASDRPHLCQARNSTSDVPLQITFGRIRNGGQSSLIGVLHDVQKLSQLEERFIRGQREHAVNAFATDVAREFDDVFSRISLLNDSILSRMNPGDQFYEAHDLVRQEINRGSGLSGQLATLSLSSIVKPKIFELNACISSLYGLLERLSGTRIEIWHERDAPASFIYADIRMVEQAIMNLVVNSRDAMKGHGRVTISVQNERLTSILDTGLDEIPSGRYIALRIEDVGEGIHDSIRTKIFEPFYSTRDDPIGKGCGLSTVRGIMKQAGGAVMLENSSTSGSTFALYFPAAERP